MVTVTYHRVNMRYINTTTGTSSNILRYKGTYLSMYLWRSLYTLNLLSRQVELLWAFQLPVVVSLVYWALSFPFVGWFYKSALGLILFQITPSNSFTSDVNLPHATASGLVVQHHVSGLSIGPGNYYVDACSSFRWTFTTLTRPITFTQIASCTGVLYHAEIPSTLPWFSPAYRDCLCM